MSKVIRVLSVVLEKEFVKNKAVFHKKCTVEYGQARLDSLKRKFEESEATLRNETETSVSPNKTRRSFAATNFTEMCFFVKSLQVLIRYHVEQKT